MNLNFKIKNIDISMRNHAHMYERFKKLADSHPLTGMFKDRIKFGRIKKDLIRKKKGATFHLVKQILLAGRFNPALFLEMKQYDIELEAISSGQGFERLWQPLFTSLLNVIDYQTLDQYFSLMALMKDVTIGCHLNKMRRIVGQNRYHEICRHLSDLAEGCASIDTVQRFLGCFFNCFGDKSHHVSDMACTLKVAIFIFRSLMSKDGDDRRLLSGWEIYIKLAEAGGKATRQTISLSVLFSHICFLSNLQRQGFAAEEIEHVYQPGNSACLRNSISFIEERLVLLSLILRRKLSDKKRAIIEKRLSDLEEEPFYRFFLQELLIKYCDQLDDPALILCFDMIDDCICYSKKELFEVAESINKLPPLVFYQEISTIIQQDNKNVLLRYIRYLQKQKTWPRLVLIYLLFKVVLYNRNLQNLAQLLELFENDPLQFERAVGVVPERDETAHKLDKIFEVYFYNWLNLLLIRDGYDFTAYRQLMETILQNLDPAEEIHLFLYHLQENLKLNIDLDQWLFDIQTLISQAERVNTA